MKEEATIEISKEQLLRLPVIGFLIRKITTPRPWARYLIKQYPHREKLFAGISFGLEVFYLSLILILLGKVTVYCPAFVGNVPVDIPPGLMITG